jgi:hypothetical protein
VHRPRTGSQRETHDRFDGVLCAQRGVEAARFIPLYL